MINGVRPSEVHEVNRSKLQHYKKLMQIANSPGRHSKARSLSKLRSIQQMHVHKIFNQENKPQFSPKRYAGRNLEKQSEITYLNRKLVDTITKITTRRTNSFIVAKVLKKQIQKAQLCAGHWHNFFKEKKLKTEIQKSNPSIGKRIMQKKSELDKRKGDKEFEKSRKIVKRLQKFDHFRQMSVLANCDRLFARPDCFM